MNFCSRSDISRFLIALYYSFKLERLRKHVLFSPKREAPFSWNQKTSRVTIIKTFRERERGKENFSRMKSLFEIMGDKIAKTVSSYPIREDK